MVRRHRYYKPKRKLYNLPTAQRPMRQRQSPEPVKINTSIIKNIIGTIFFICAGIWFGYFFIFSPNFSIKNINITGNENIPITEIQEIINEQLDKKAIYAIGQRNILFFSKNDLISAIGERYIVENIKINKKLPFTLSVHLEEKLARVVLRVKIPISITHTKAQAIEEDVEAGQVAGDQVSHNIEDGEEEVEQGEEQISYSEDYYYLDVNGIVVSSAEMSENDLQKFPVIEIEIPDTQKINSRDILLDRETIEFIFSVYRTVSKMPQNVSVAYVKLDLSIADEMTFVTTENWQGMLSTSVSLETQIKKLELALDEKIKDKRATLQYVDLRIKDRVYFK